MVSSPTRTGNKSPLAQWFNESIATEDMRVRFRLSGNNLHILCEAEDMPNQIQMLGRLLPALQTVDLNTLVPANQPTIEQVFLYGKGRSGRQAEWNYPIDLSQLDYHLAQFQEMQLQAFSLLAEEEADSAEAVEAIAPTDPESAAFTLDPSPELEAPSEASSSVEMVEDAEPFTLDPSAELAEATDSLLPTDVADDGAEEAETLDVATESEEAESIPEAAESPNTVLPEALDEAAIAIPEPAAEQESQPVIDEASEDEPAPAMADGSLGKPDDFVTDDSGEQAADSLAAETDVDEPSQGSEVADSEADTAQDAATDEASADGAELPVAALTEEQEDDRAAEATTDTLNPLLDTPAEDKAAARSFFEQAQGGEPEAIAQYLTHDLSRQNIAMRVSARALPYPGTSGIDAITQHAQAGNRQPQRLWILCEATYSPTPAALSAPLAKQLRSLNLQGFRDAVVVVQVRGEARPDWMLRVDLTPPQTMLREWARWGDVQAITRLLNQALQAQDCAVVNASLQESTLHLAVSLMEEAAATAPEQDATCAEIAEMLQSLVPQGIHAATVYGQLPDAETPTWVDWLDLPAAMDSARSGSALEQAQQGDWEAIAFLLNRLLNPDQDEQLATGGIRLQLLPKRDRTQQTILHIMADAPICPTQDAVGIPVARFLQDLKVPQLAGVRVYGREAGKKRPLWCHSAELQERVRLVPEAVPEFAASGAYVGELIAPGGELVLQSDLAGEEQQSVWTRWRDRLSQGFRRTLLASHLFTSPDGAESRPAQPSWAIAMIWGAAGILLALQVDWGMARLMRPTQAMQAQAELTTRSAETTDGAQFSQVAANGELASTTTADGTELPYTPATVEQQLQTAEILSQESPYPPFNSPQLDEKLLLYHERMKQQASPADVLIVGSSRALRGIDPAALQQELADLGYSDVSVFNFGVNGATAQVVDLVLRRILESPQLPRLVVWADGARAFNSNTVDVTYNGIAQSSAYQDLQRGRLERPDLSAILEDGIDLDPTPDEKPAGGIQAPLQASYAALDRTLSEELGAVSSAYPLRDRLKTQFQEAIAQVFPSEFAIPAQTAGFPNNSLPSDSLQALSEAGREMIDFDGFLPLALRFNPATYFQEYARVRGRYDSDYTNFQLTGVQAESMNRLLRELGDRQIPVVFVNLPLTDEYLDSDRQDYEQTFRQFMVEADLQYDNLIFRDLAEIWLTDYDYFSDPSHLNRYGAYEVARRLAQDPLIPWGLLNEADEDATDSTTTAQQSAD